MYRLAFALAVTSALTLFCGCGSDLGLDENLPAQTVLGEAGPPGPQGPPGAEGPVGLPGSPGAISVLSWGRFSYRGETVHGEGGPVRVLSFSRLSEGMYEVVYDVAPDDVGVVVPLATGGGLESPINGANLVSIVGATQGLFDEEHLTVQVFCVTSSLDLDDWHLADSDSMFSLVVFGTYRETAPNVP